MGIWKRRNDEAIRNSQRFLVAKKNTEKDVLCDRSSSNFLVYIVACNSNHGRARLVVSLLARLSIFAQPSSMGFSPLFHSEGCASGNTSLLLVVLPRFNCTIKSVNRIYRCPSYWCHSNKNGRSVCLFRNFPSPSDPSCCTCRKNYRRFHLASGLPQYYIHTYIHPCNKFDTGTSSCLQYAFLHSMANTCPRTLASPMTPQSSLLKSKKVKSAVVGIDHVLVVDCEGKHISGVAVK